jgi:hypothetical protein
MTRCRLPCALVVCISFLVAGVASAGEEGENLARGKAYTLEPAPNYPHCTDPGDTAQLTDGKRVEGHFWTQTGTVGWSGIVPVIITFDLGRVEPIAGLSYSTAAGVAGVSFPASLFVLLSLDGKTWHVAADLVERSASKALPPAEGYALHRFESRDLSLHGRWVKLVIDGGQYTFVDEVEVFRGDPADLARDFPGKAVTDARAFFDERRIVACLRRRLAADLEAIRVAVRTETIGDAERGLLAAELESIEREIRGVELGALESSSTVFPINETHRRIFAAQARAWRALEPAGSRGGIHVWQTNPWDPLSPATRPGVGGAVVDISMMRNEHRSAAFNLTNTVGEPLEAVLRFEGLPGGTAPPWVDVHEVLFTDTRSGTPVAAALPRARREGATHVISLESGLTRQVWLTVHSKGLASGRYQGSIAIELRPGRAGGGPAPSSPAAVPVRVRVYPMEFPGEPSLHLGGWDYTDRERCYEATPENRAELIRHLRERFVDTPWAQSAVLPTGRYDAEGKQVEAPSSAEFEEWLRRWPAAGNYCVFAAVGDSFAGFPLASEPFRRAVGEWIRWWGEWLESKGVDPARLCLLLVDEPASSEQDRVIIEYAKAIRAADARVVIWEDPIWREPWDATPALFEVSHVLCPNLPMWLDGGAPFAEFYVRHRAAGRKLWFYSCSGPGKLLDPYAYHRLQAWCAFQYGAEGMGFWAFGDSNGAPSWNEYATTVGAYTPLFLDAKTVTAGKHMEAIREGVEDFEYLRMLERKLGALERSPSQDSPRPPIVEEAKRLLAGAPGRVTACLTSSSVGFWREPKDRSLADRVRVEILECLRRLELLESGEDEE